jgi:hypothetical protein
MMPPLKYPNKIEIMIHIHNNLLLVKLINFGHIDIIDKSNNNPDN